MTYNPSIHRRRSIRLQNYDYSRAGAYFVTICTHNRQCLFGEIMNGQIRLNDGGQTVAEVWEWLASQYDHVELNEWVVMPNHIHGIIVMADDCRGGSPTAPGAHRKPLGRLIGAYKTVSTKRFNTLRQTPGAKLWQRNYWEHIIRNESELSRIREYIRDNPTRWELDKLHPDQPKFGVDCNRGGSRTAPTRIREPFIEYITESWMI